MSRLRKQVPEFKDEAAERVFWESHDSSECLNWSKAEYTSLSNLNPSIRPTLIRLPESMLK